MNKKSPQPSRPPDKRPPKDKPPFPGPRKPKNDHVESDAERAERVVADWPAPTREQCAQLLRILGPHLPEHARAA